MRILVSILIRLWLQQYLIGGRLVRWRGNVSFLDKLIACSSFLVNYSLYPVKLLAFCRSYYNYEETIMNFWRNRYPIEAILRNGKHIRITNERTYKLPWYEILRYDT